ncbi:hypothetical protein BDV98DRAFT_503186, partial [Pterulicium gracile]
EQDQKLINQAINTFTLNEAQKQTFCIVAHHATTAKFRPLYIHLGGMGGTGKSQVIKALHMFFKSVMKSTE